MHFCHENEKTVTGPICSRIVALYHQNSHGKPLAVVEAKKTSVDAALGREQAKQYCYNI